MRMRRGGVPLIVIVASMLDSCQNAARNAGVPTPEAEQVVGESMKQLYMTASAAAPQSAKQQKVILRMAEKASNGKELLLVMRAAIGVFPSDARSQAEPAESQVHSMVTNKMIQLATLDQLLAYESQYAVAQENSRAFVQRLFELGGANSDPRVWYRIRVAASHLKLTDLERQAQAKGDQLAAR